MFVPRMSVNIDAVLPSLKGIENTISSAETWLQKSEPFLSATSSMGSSPCSLLELPVLNVCQPHVPILVSVYFFVTDVIFGVFNALIFAGPSFPV